MQKGTLHLWGFEDWLSGGEKGEVRIPNPARLLVDLAGQEEMTARILEAANCSDLRTTLLPVPQGGPVDQDQRVFREALGQAAAEVRSGDLVVAMGQHLPLPDTRLRVETRLPGVFMPGPNVSLRTGPDRAMPEEIEMLLHRNIEAGSLPNFLLSEDAGRFYCNAVGNFLDGQFFIHLSGLNDPSERPAFWAKYSKYMIEKWGVSSVEEMGYASAQDNFEAVCRFLAEVREFRVQ